MNASTPPEGDDSAEVPSNSDNTAVFSEVRTNHRGLESIFQGLEPITGDYRAYSTGVDLTDVDVLAAVGQSGRTNHRGL